jgi:hypothetical protein
MSVSHGDMLKKSERRLLERRKRASFAQRIC